MQKFKVQIETEFITLTNLLKFAGVVMSGGQAHELIEEGLVVMSGGQAHELIEEGLVSLNGQPVNEKRKKIRAGDVVKVKDLAEITVENEN